jgi:hypothetical protein
MAGNKICRAYEIFSGKFCLKISEIVMKMWNGLKWLR